MCHHRNQQPQNQQEKEFIMKAKNEVSKPVKKQAVALKDLRTKKDPKGGSGPFSQSTSNIEDNGRAMKETNDVLSRGTL